MLVNDQPGSALPAATPARPTPTDVPTAIITGSAAGAPRDVRLADRGTSVTLTWSDPSGGKVPFIVIGSGPGGETLESKQVDRGRTT